MCGCGPFALMEPAEDLEDMILDVALYAARK
jgi:hypothetical protein